MFAIVGMPGYRCRDCNSIFSLQTFTRRLPAGTPKFEFQRSVQTISWAKRPRCQIHHHPSPRRWMEYSFVDLDKLEEEKNEATTQ
jgi:hypothetical protein